MKTIHRIQQLPEAKREQLMWVVVATALVLLLFIWIGTSYIPKPDHTNGNFFTAVKNEVNKARANNPSINK